MEKKDILCPDCADNYISETRYIKFGKCDSCYRRETMAKTRGYEYIKFVDLPQAEKDRLAHQRKLNNKSAKARKQKNELPKIKSVKNQDTNNVRKNQIYTPDVIDSIFELANDNTTIKELLNLIAEKYPDKKFNEGNLKNVIRRYKLPHLVMRKVGVNKKLEEVIPDVIQDNNNDNEYVEEINEDIIVNTEKSSCNKVIDGEPERFKPIRAEVKSILDKKFKSLGCVVERNYNTDDYINAVDMLLYLKKNIDVLVKNRTSQLNIMNAYQSDMIHEFENVIAKEGDTYLSDKMHIIRDYRRYYEIDQKDVQTLKTILSKLEIEDLENAERILNRNRNYVKNPIFKPYIDTTLIDKYDWAHPINEGDAKSNVSVTKYNPMGFNKVNNSKITRVGLPKNTPPTNQLSSKIRKSLHTFRVSCKISGGGYGTFAEWHRDYECKNKNIAMAYAKNTLNQLSSNRKDMLWSDLSVVELNVDN